MKRDFGLVLSGGGARGAYEAGVWKALRETGLDGKIGAVSGTSVGALNTLFFVQKDYDLVLKLWSSLRQEDIAPVNFAEIRKNLNPFKSETETVFSQIVSRLNAVAAREHTLTDTVKETKNLKLTEYIKNYKGAISAEKLKNLLFEYADYDKIINSDIEGYICATRLSPKLSAEYFKLHEMKSKSDIVDILLASSAIFPIFTYVNIGDIPYVDGGFLDKAPLKPLYQEGYRKFVVVHLSRVIRNSTSLKKLPDCKIIEIIPNLKMNTEFITTTMDFTTENLKKRIEHGYSDAIAAFKNNGLI